MAFLCYNNYITGTASGTLSYDLRRILRLLSKLALKVPISDMIKKFDYGNESRHLYEYKIKGKDYGIPLGSFAHHGNRIAD